MPVNNKGAGQRVQVITPGMGSVYLNNKWTISSAGGVPVQTRVRPQEISGGDITDRQPFTFEADARATATVAASPSTATLTIGGAALTDAGGARTPGSDDYDGTLGTVALIAADIVAAINDSSNSFTAIATAQPGVGGAVRLTAVDTGVAGNVVTLTSSSGDITVSGPLFTGGVDPIPPGHGWFTVIAQN